MATVELSNSEKLAILKGSKMSVFTSLAQVCYQIGIDPFNLDIDTFEPTAEQQSKVGLNISETITTLKQIISSIAELEALIVE